MLRSLLGRSFLCSVGLGFVAGCAGADSGEASSSANAGITPEPQAAAAPSTQTNPYPDSYDPDGPDVSNPDGSDNPFYGALQLRRGGLRGDIGPIRGIDS